jgi:hypothetical protein
MRNQAEEKDASLLASLKWWPAVAGAALAAFVALPGSAGGESASILAASGFVYLGAAALRKPSVAWPLFFVTFVVITAGRIGIIPIDPTWIILGLATVTFLYGVRQGAGGPWEGLPLQAIAMVVVGAGAAFAVAVNGAIGASLVAAGLFGHAAWDVYHHRVNKVVNRSMAEFCCVLDTGIAVAIVVALLRV